jgi:hypothetical protein
MFYKSIVSGRPACITHAAARGKNQSEKQSESGENLSAPALFLPLKNHNKVQPKFYFNNSTGNGHILKSS